MQTRSILSLRNLLAVALLLILSGTLLLAAGDNVRLILMVDRSNFDKVGSAVSAAGGEVNLKFKYVDAISVTVPFDKMRSILSMPEVLGNWKDAIVTLREPKPREIPGYGTMRFGGGDMADASGVLTPAQLTGSAGGSVNTYYPYGNKQINAYAFSQLTGHLGENVVIAIIDGGISRLAKAVAGNNGERIVGTANMTGDGIPADDPANYFHGTAVACCAGANAVFWFNPASYLVRAVEMYAPGSVISNDPLHPGLKGLPMVGPAPFAKFYAIKVYPADGSGIPWSVWASGLEKAIELKEAYNAGTGGCNIQIANMSFGNMNEFAGNEPLFAPLAKRAHDAGMILAVAAGNEGPTGLSILTPGDCKNILTCGATDAATNERIALDFYYQSIGLGALFRPLNNHVVANYSSRGPTADGRSDPDIAAPGTFPFFQLPNGAVTCLASGTSFAAPTVAGAAALLLSAHPGATPDQIRGALLQGANPAILDDKPGKQDQGYGFLDVLAAHRKFGAFNPPDFGAGSPYVRVNVKPYGITPIDADVFSGSTGWLLPGQRKEFYVETTMQPLVGVTVNVTFTAELPFSQQNQFIGGDDALVSLATAKTSMGDYITGVWINGSRTFHIEPHDLDFGLTRVTVTGDSWSKGRVKVDLSITKDTSPLNLHPVVSDAIWQGDLKEYRVNVPAGTSQARFILGWVNGWEAYPTNDLDIYLFDPAGNFIALDNDNDNILDGAGLSDPERVTVYNPASGTWTLLVNGFQIWHQKTPFMVFSEMNVSSALSKNGSPSSGEMVPDSYVLYQNYPNPFNPSTVIKYGLPVDAQVRLSVFNLLGELVASVVDEPQKAGFHQAVFRDPGLSSGTYFYRLQAGNWIEVRKFILLK